MAANSANSIDNEFEAFLDEVEQLSIHHDVSASVDLHHHHRSDGKKTADNGSIASATDKHAIINAKTTHKINATTRKIKSEKKKEIIANAADNQRAWSEFKIPNNHNSASSISEVPVSFQIKSARDGKKKKKKKKQLAIIMKGHGNNQPASDPCSETTLVSKINEKGCPRWTLIIDTCSLLHDNGMGVNKIIHLANHAANVHVRAQSQRNVASMTAIVDEPIDIVVPFKVWSELEYQSKSSEAANAYAARLAIRMLRHVLELDGRVDSNQEGVVCHSVLRSQSLLESNEAAAKFLSMDSQSPTNDDYILACAMMEHEQFQSCTTSREVAAGGVVVVTLDNNLACKAYANGLKVNSPFEFEQYYQTRMASLRQRAAGNLDSVLKR